MGDSLIGESSAVLNLKKIRPSDAMAFARGEAGNFGLLFGLLLPVLLFFLGAGIDFTRINVVRTDLTESCDAAALAVARVSETPRVQALSESERSEFLRQYGEDFFRSNFQNVNVIQNLAVDFDVTPQTVTPDVSGDLHTYILGTAFSLFRGEQGQRPLKLTCESEITLSGSGRVELALVVDVSGSMGAAPAGGGPRKIDSLRDSVDAMMQILYGDRRTSDNIRVGVVPFNGFVNPGGNEEWSESWTDINASAVYHGDRFFHVDQNGVIDVNTPVNHQTLFSSTPNIDWQGCVEARPYPLDEIDFPSGRAPSFAEIREMTDIPPLLSNASALNRYQRRTREAFLNQPALSVSLAELQRDENTLWVPFFAPDEPDCIANSGGNCEGRGNFVIDFRKGAVNRRFTGADFFWFDRPLRNGMVPTDYLNRDFIDDDLYTGSANRSTLPFQQYAHIVDKSRAAIQFPQDVSSSAVPGVPASDQHGASRTELIEFQRFLRGYGAQFAGEDEYVVRQGYVGWLSDATALYEGKYDLNTTSRQSAGSVFDSSGNTLRGANMLCPQAILSMTNSRNTVENFMDELLVRGSTNSAYGAVWGERLLSPEAPFEDPIADDDPQWQKAVVILTDGENIVNSRRTHLRPTQNELGTELIAYGYGLEERMGVGINTASEMQDEINNKLLRTCQRMKDRGYLVYTIMFDVTGDEIETLYRACASTPSEPFFFQAGNEDQLEEAFENIAADLVSLHISR